MKRILPILFLLFLAITPAHAQKTQAAIVSEINVNMPSSCSQCITAAILRSTLIDIVDSYWQSASTVTPSSLSATQPYAQIVASSDYLYCMWDGTTCVPWMTLIASTHSIVFSSMVVSGVQTSTSSLNAALTVSGTSSGVGSAISANVSPAGQLTGNYLGVGNSFVTTDTIKTVNANDFYTGNYFNHTVESGFTGQREGLSAYLYIDGAPANTLSSGNYSALNGIGTAEANVGGTSGTAYGNIFGGGSVGVLQNGSTYFNNLTGWEFNTAAQTGSSVKLKSIAQFSGRSDDAVAGSTVNAMLWLYNQVSATATWTDVVLVDGVNGQWPLGATSDILRVIAGSAETLTNGIDLSNSNLTFSGCAYKSAGFCIDANGNITAATANSFGVRLGGSSSGMSILAQGSGNGFLQLSSAGTGPLYLSTDGGTHTEGTITDNGGMQIGSPTGGDQGSGTINVASGYYVNGTSIFSSPTFSPAPIVSGAAISVTTNEISYGGTTSSATSSNCSVTNAKGCVILNIAGTTHYVPYF